MRIIISGTVGVGKSSTTEHLIKKLEAKGYTVNLLKEETVDNPYLAGFYEKPEKWAFIAQTDFVLERFKQWIKDERYREEEEKKGNDKIITIYDRHFIDDYIFAEMHSVKENISQLNSVVYQVIYRELLEKLQESGNKPDYLFLLKAKLPTIMNRLKSRGRSEEQETELEYWTELYSSYYEKPKFKYHFEKNVKEVITIDTENLEADVVADKIIEKLNI